MTILGHRDEYAKKLGLPITARFNHSPSEIDRVANDLQAMRGYDREKAEEIAKAQLDAIKHRESAKKTIFVVKEHNWRRKLEIAAFFTLLGLVLLFSHKAHAQSTVVRGAAKGTTPANNTTATSTDPNHTGLDVNVLNGGSGGTASGFGAAFPGTGTAAGASDGVNMQPLKVDGSLNLKVNCAVGCAGGSTTPTDAFANPTTAGLQFAFMASWNGATWDRIKGDTTNGLWVNCKSGCAGGSSTPADTFATPTTAGLGLSFPMLWNGATFDRQYGDKTNGAWVNIKNTSIAVTGTFWQATQPVSGTFWQATQPVSWSGQSVSVTGTVDPSDRAARLLGVIYGSQGQQFKQTATNFNGAVELFAGATAYDARQIRNLAAGTDTVVSNQGTGNTLANAWPVKVTDGVNSMPTGDSSARTIHTTVDNASVAVTNQGLTDIDAAIAAVGAAAPANASQIGGTDGTNLVRYYVDPCQRGIKSYSPVNISTATTVRFAAPASTKKTYICSIVLVAAGADNVNIIEGTGGTCGTATAGVSGGTTAATGFNLAANGGLTMGNGQGAIFATTGTNVDMCLITSAAVQLSGHISWVQFP